ncbi:MAG: CoA transferase [Erythrobacter sp.]|uniref:CaiB/BaiF CoA transferase family protein n=1 Tax=Erythrobacter sp. TaxID=1042 RepID=UPI00326514B9
MEDSPLPLAGVRVLDLSRVLAGPWATQLLADYGADVVKIEKPGTGDDTRGWGPPYTANGEAAYFHAANRNKKSVAIDMASGEGAQLIRDLASQSDIVVENFKVGGLAKYGLDYASVSAENPKIVYCSITGFGQTGPNSHRPGYDYLIQAMTGLMSVTGQPDGSAGAEPMKVGVAVSDLFTGLYATTAILAALRNAEAIGMGCQLDVALHDCQLAALANQAANFLATGVPPQRLGNAHPSIVPYQVFDTGDGHIVVAVGNDSQFQAFCECLNRPDIGARENWRTNKGRVEDRANLIALISPLLKTRTTQEWAETFNSGGIPHSPIRSVGEALQSDQVAARSQISDHAEGLRTVGQPVPFPGQPNEPPPLLGAHTDQVLRQYLGFDGSSMDNLRTIGAIG